MTDSFVYVIRAQESARIKIGVAKNPQKRLANLQVGSPEYLLLLGAVPGDRAVEAGIHSELRASRVHGEWFEYTDHVRLVVHRLLGWDRPTPQQIESANKAATLRAQLAEMSQ